MRKRSKRKPYERILNEKRARARLKHIARVISALTVCTVVISRSHLTVTAAYLGGAPHKNAPTQIEMIHSQDYTYQIEDHSEITLK